MRKRNQPGLRGCEMVNRVIQQKRIKMARQRQAWAKPFSMKRTGIVANPGFRNEQGDFVPMSIGSRSKAGGVVADPWLDTIFKDKNPLYRIDEFGHYIPNETGIFQRRDVPRAVVLAKLIQSTNNAGSLQG